MTEDDDGAPNVYYSLPTPEDMKQMRFHETQSYSKAHLKKHNRRHRRPEIPLWNSAMLAENSMVWSPSPLKVHETPVVTTHAQEKADYAGQFVVIHHLRCSPPYIMLWLYPP